MTGILIRQHMARSNLEGAARQESHEWHNRGTYDSVTKDTT